MNDLSNAFHELAQRDERAFAHVPRDASAIAAARKARHRTRAVQATGGTFAVGALAVGGIQLLPGADAGLNAAASPSASSTAEVSTTAVPAAEATTSASEDVVFDTMAWDESGLSTLGQFELDYLCGAPAPEPTAGRATISLDSVKVRPTDFVMDLEPWFNGTETGPVPVVDADGHTTNAVIGDASLVSTNGETLYADVPATLMLLAKDGEIVGIMGADRVDPTEQPRMIEAPEGTPEWANQEQWVTETGITPILDDEPVSVSTGYFGWSCPDGFGELGSDLGSDDDKHVYPPLSDYLEPGDYEAYVVARVVVDEQSAAEHVLREKGFDLWNGWALEEQAAEFGLETANGPVDEEDGTTPLLLDVPVPGDYLPATASDEVIISEPLTVTID